MSDEALIDRLVELCSDAATRDRAIETIDSWARNDRSGRLAEIRSQLLRDPVIADASGPGNFLYVVGSGGWGVDVTSWLPGFVREAEQLSEEQRRHEARRFLGLLRLSNGTAPMQVRTTLAGVELDVGFAVELPFGRLRPAVPTDFSADPRLSDLPPATVFEYETELPAQFGSPSAYPFDNDWGRELAQSAEDRHDERVARVLLALVLAREGPIQEHLTMRAPRYLGGGTGMNPIPLAPIVVSYPYRLADGLAVDELVRIANLVSNVRVGKLGVVVRRYLMAVTERTRPADQIVDCSIAFEALTGTGRGPQQGEALTRLIGRLPASGDAVIEHKRVKDARDVIIHEGRTPQEAPMIASRAKQLVRLGLHAAVRQELAAEGSRHLKSA